MAVVSYLVILVSEGTITVCANGGRPMSFPLLTGHGGKWNLLGQNFAYCFALRRDVLVETRHHVGAAVDCGWRLVLWKVRHSVTAKPTDVVFVYDAGFCIWIGVVGSGCQEGLKITNEIEFKRMFFVVVFEF